MPRPLVSVLLPNLNNVRYLPERLETIYSQTCRDWELIIVDNYSDDGAWELFQQHAQRDSRIRLSQAPRAGMYANWNNCLAKASGKYIYIATSDDTMEPNCFEKLLHALELHPEASLAQCGLEIIDSDGKKDPANRWDRYTLGRYNESLVQQPNLRIAPHDGLLHTALYTVCTSITQLLIKREVFDELGGFETRWGSVGDFEWQMRVALVYHCIFLPDKLATWRVHPEQATGKLTRSEVCKRHLEMAREAFRKVYRFDKKRLDGIDAKYFLRMLELDLIESEMVMFDSRRAKLPYLVGSFAKRPAATIDWIRLRKSTTPWSLSDCEERFRRLNHELKRFNIPMPVFLSN